MTRRVPPESTKKCVDLSHLTSSTQPCVNCVSEDWSLIDSIKDRDYAELNLSKQKYQVSSQRTFLNLLQIVWYQLPFKDSDLRYRKVRSKDTFIHTTSLKPFRNQASILCEKQLYTLASLPSLDPHLSNRLKVAQFSSGLYSSSPLVGDGVGVWYVAYLRTKGNPLRPG